MHNPTRRVKRVRQPLSSSRPQNPLAETSESRLNIALRDGNPEANGFSHYVRHRQATQLDLLRDVMLIALVVVTVVLYFVLWELERSSFASVPKPISLTKSATNGNQGAASVRYPPIIARDPPTLPLVEELNVPDDRNAVPLSMSGRTTSGRWPPPINQVPEERDTDVEEQVDNHTREDEFTETKLISFDATYCNNACRFLLPVRVGEQESKARVHFMQLLVLARQLNRTIVLPNVAKSRMSACSEWPFGVYYDTNGFARGTNALDPSSPLAIDFDEFAKWVDERPVSPKSFVVSMGSIHQDRLDLSRTQADVPFVVEKAKVNPKILSCLESKLARLRSSLPETALAISFDTGSPRTHSDVSARFVQLLSRSLDLDADSVFDVATGPGYKYTPQAINSSRLSLADMDVLVLDYDLRHPLSTEPEPPLKNFDLHYTPALYDLADRLADNLGPFLAIHWRMENVPLQNLAWCAASLVSTLRMLLQDDITGKNVEHVWLATDHPRPLRPSMDAVPFLVDGDETVGETKSGVPLQNHGPLKKSSTFKAILLEHDDAIGILTEAFQPGGDLGTWKLTDLAEQLRRYPYVEGRFEVNETLLDDSGVFGILDKLVAVHARVFVSGSKDCSKTRFVHLLPVHEFDVHKKASSFSKQVIEARQETFETERGKGTIRKVVEYFGKW